MWRWKENAGGYEWETLAQAYNAAGAGIDQKWLAYKGIARGKGENGEFNTERMNKLSTGLDLILDLEDIEQY